MSFGVGVGDIIAVANIANKVRKRFVDSPDQFKAVADEVKSLSNVLRDLEDLIPERTITDQQSTHLKETLQGCKETLTALDQVLDKYHDLAPTAGHTSLAQKSRRLWKRLTFEPEDVSNLRSSLTSKIGLFAAFIGSLALGVSHATKAGVDRLNTYHDKEQYFKVLDWLSNSDFPAQQNDIYKDCQEGTGQWLLKSNEYMKWIDGVEPTLFCPGIPGAGKTFLTSIVIHDLGERFDGDPEVVVTYLYFNYKRHAEQTIENLVASLLKQLVKQRPDFYSILKSLYTLHGARGTRPSVDELSKTLHAAINRCTKAFIVIDALDECTDSRTRLKLLKEVTALQTQQGTVRFLTTSRFIPDIVAKFDEMPTIKIRADDGDVRRYLEHHLEDLPGCVRRNQLLQATIVTEISGAVDGMFLLAQLHLGSLSDKTTVKGVKLALQQLPKGSQSLHVAYDKTIERIDNQPPGYQQLAKQTLSWIVYATRQLSVLELRYALAVEDEATELDEENLAETDEIIHACAGLVTIEQDTNIIRLVHYTTQEYLERKFLAWEPLAETAITRTCITYLSFDIISAYESKYSKSDSDIVRFLYLKDLKALKNLPFFDYAVDSWHHHAENCWNDIVEQLILSFLEEDPQVLYYGADRYIHGYHVDHKANYDYSGMNGCQSIHFVALFGSARIATALMQAGYNIRAVDGDGRTPLINAARFGHLAVAKSLLKDSNLTDNKGFTALYYAAMNGHESVVKLLLSCEGIDVNAQSPYGYDTPLRVAIMNRHEGVVRLLLERDEIDVSGRKLGLSKDRFGDPALITAIILEDDAIFEQLLGRDEVDPNCRNDQGETALIVAVKFENFEAVKNLLMRKDIDVNFQNNQGHTALMLAADSENYAVVNILLERRDIDVNCQNNKGRTVLMMSINSTYHVEAVDDMVRKLREDQTALMSVADSEKNDVVNRLLERDDIDVNCQDNEGQTALMFAASHENYNAVKMLLERDDIDRTGYDRDYKDTPYYVAQEL